MGKWSKVAIGIYLVLGAAAFMAAISADDPLGSIFLIALAVPWSFIMFRIVDTAGINIVSLNYVLMLIGIGLNTLIFYWVARRLYRRSPSK